MWAEHPAVIDLWYVATRDRKITQSSPLEADRELLKCLDSQERKNTTAELESSGNPVGITAYSIRYKDISFHLPYG